MKKPEKGVGKGKAEIAFEVDTITFKSKSDLQALGETVGASLCGRGCQTGRQPPSRRRLVEGHLPGTGHRRRHGLPCALGAFQKSSGIRPRKCLIMQRRNRPFRPFQKQVLLENAAKSTVMRMLQKILADHVSKGVLNADLLRHPFDTAFL